MSSNPLNTDCKTDFHIQHNGAEVRSDGEQLIVSTGVIKRRFRWLANGLGTTQVAHIAGQLAWRNDAPTCDWQLPSGEEPGEAMMKSLTAEVSDDEGFTTEHIRITAIFDYPRAGLELQWQAWVWPGADGIRTQLSARLHDTPPQQPTSQPALQGGPTPGRVDRIPLGDPSQIRRSFGYYNDTQNRNDTHLDILHEHVNRHPLTAGEWCDWASVMCLESESGGIALVKESHKCVNQRGYQTGGFSCHPATGLTCTGWGLTTKELDTRRFTAGWATWCIAWAGDDVARETAFKRFDAVRYPIDPKRDIYIQANTWGSTPSGNEARLAATEPHVLQELEAVAQLGIDFLQIDDGWQTPPGHASWQTDPAIGWHPHPQSYPDGWKNIRRRAEQLGVKLGLWAAAQPVSLQELIDNYESGGFLQYKLDFAELKSRKDIDDLMDKVRAFIKHTGHRVRVNWDVTEISRRYGYFFARDYGSIYLENRKPAFPQGVVYRPHTVLRDLWQLSKYLNLHRFQCSVQNIDRVDPTISDAHLHTHGYAVAITLMGIPLFFQQTVFYDDKARAQIKPLLTEYKKHRQAIYHSIVYPIGDKPNNASWTGFQAHDSKTGNGYLTVFREPHNDQPVASLHPHYLAGKTIELRDLKTQATRTVKVPADGSVSFTIDQAPGFLFLQYTSK